MIGKTLGIIGLPRNSAQAIRITELQSTFVAAVTHEFKSSITSIRLFQTDR